ANEVAQRIFDRRYPRNAQRSANALARMSVTGRPFSDVRQLRYIPGMRPEWLAAIEPLTTVFGAELVNPLTAPAGVIAALPGIRKEQVDAFLKTRGTPRVDADRLVRTVGDAQQYLAVKPQRVASVELVAELVDGYAVAARTIIVMLPQDS